MRQSSGSKSGMKRKKGAEGMLESDLGGGEGEERMEFDSCRCIYRLTQP